MTPVVSLSTAESEIRAIDEAFSANQEACWLTEVLEDLGNPLLGNDPFNKILIRMNSDFCNLAPVFVFEDNLNRRLRWIKKQVQRK